MQVMDGTRRKAWARSMATSGRGTGVVSYNVQTAVDDKHHLIVAHEVTNIGNDRTQLASMAQQAREATGIENLTVVADRGYFKGDEILKCERAGITTYVPKPLTSNSKADGRFGKQDFVYVPEKNEYRCPAGQSLIYRYTNLEAGLTTHAYWTSNCQQCAIKAQCTNLSYRRVRRWEHEDVIDAMQRRLDREPERMRQRRQTLEAGHLVASIPCQRLVELLRQFASVLDQRVDDRLGVFAIHLHEHDVTRLAFDQCRDLAVAAAKHQVSFPVTRHCTILNRCRPLADRDGAHDLAVGTSLLRVMPRPTHAARPPQMLQQFFLQSATRLNEEAAVDGLV